MINNTGEKKILPEKILVVDDEDDILEILRFNLENEGFEVDTANSGEDALAKLSPEHRLILLDIMMEGMSGYRVAEEIRKKNIQTPIIFLTAKNTENDMLTGFSVGADDYIAKPFSIKEVIARVKAVTRRNYETFPIENTENDIVTFGALRIDTVAKTLSINGCNTVLTKKEYEILCLLIEHLGRVFTREEILASVWKDESYVLERTVDVHIARLRKKLNEYGRCIANRAGYGYFFDNNVIVN